MSDWYDNLTDTITTNEQKKAAEKQQREQAEAEAKRIQEAEKHRRETNSALVYAKTAEQTQALLQEGADPNTNCRDETPLLNAKSIEQVKLLLEHGADVNYVQGNNENLITRYARSNDKQMETPGTPEIIALAAQYGINQEILDSSLARIYTEDSFNALIKNGADVQKFDWKTAAHKYELYLGRELVYGKYNDYSIEDPNKAREMNKIMKAAIKEGYDFKQDLQLLEQPVVKEIVNEVLYEEKYNSSFTKDEQNFVKAAQENNNKEIRNYLTQNDRLSADVVGYMSTFAPKNDFMAYYQSIVGQTEKSFVQAEDDAIVQTSDLIKQKDPEAYAKAKDIMMHNPEDQKAAKSFFNAAYGLAQENDVNATAFMIDIYQHSPEADKKHYMDSFVQLRTEGSNAQRREKAVNIKEAVTQVAGSQADKELETLSKVSYSPFSNLNQMVNNHKKQR